MFFLRYILVDGEVLDTKGKTDVFFKIYSGGW